MINATEEENEKAILAELFTYLKSDKLERK